MDKHSGPLTRRERQVLELIADGLSNDAIAKRLTLSRNTVIWYVRQIFDKLEVKRRTHAVAVARSLGLLDDAMLHHAPPLDSEEGTRHNLPLQPTPFIGRANEIKEIERLLEESHCRLLTLMGPGGIGKTQLAIQVASRQQDKYPDGVFFVSLQSLTNQEDIVPAIASSIGLIFQPDDRNQQEQLLDYFSDKSLLLLLDNCEHLLTGVHLISDLLVAAPGIKVITTSREILHLRGEYLHSVGPLQFPRRDQSIEQLETFSAVELFVDRAHHVYPEFSLSAELPDVVQICRLVGGMPLAIELAAAWVNTLSCVEIAAEIQRNLDILTTSLRDAPQRHRSVQATFDHSWKLLNDIQRTAFRRLSVFRGGCTREAAQKVADVDLRTLQALVDKSFIRRDARTGRYDMHELIRQYGEARLEAHPVENETTRDAHARYYAEFVYQHETSMIYEMDFSVPSKIHPERDNIDRAWRWALKQDMIKELGKFPAAMDYYLQAWGLFAYSNMMYGRMVDNLRAQPPNADRDWCLGRILQHFGWALHVQGRNDEAHVLLEESLPLLDGPQQGYECALSLGFLGEVKREQGALIKARQVLQQALAIFQSLQTPHGIWMANHMLGTTAHQAGELESAKKHFEAVLQVAEQVGKPVIGAMFVLPHLSITHSALGEFSEARRCLLQELAIMREIHDTFACSITLAGIAHYLLAQDHDPEAVEVLMIIAEHPLSSGNIRQQMQPHLEELTSKLPPETVDAARIKVKAVIESAHQSRNPMFLPKAYLDRLQRLLEEPLQSSD